MTSFSMLLVVCNSSAVFLSCLRIATALSATLSKDPIISGSFPFSGISQTHCSSSQVQQVHCPSSQEQSLSEIWSCWLLSSHSWVSFWLWRNSLSSSVKIPFSCILISPSVFRPVCFRLSIFFWILQCNLFLRVWFTNSSRSFSSLGVLVSFGKWYFSSLYAWCHKHTSFVHALQPYSVASAGHGFLSSHCP